MIKTNELRIGNFVSINNGFEMLVHSIFQNDTVYLDFIPPLINEADVWEEDYKDLIAIPLTEEWLLKAGFKKTRDMFINSKPKMYKIFRLSLRLMANEYTFCYENSFRKIEYVHQLQNLYFALTGEELVFSSTEP